MELIPNQTHYLYLKNGEVINLKNGEQLECRPDKTESTVVFDVDYIHNIDTTNVERYFSLIMNNDTSKISRLQYLLGAVLSGEYLNSMIIFHGKESSGKSGLSTILNSLFGNSFVEVDQSILTDSYDVIDVFETISFGEISENCKMSADTRICNMMDSTIYFNIDDYRVGHLISNRTMSRKLDHHITPRSFVNNSVTIIERRNLCCIEPLTQQNKDRLLYVEFFKNESEHNDYSRLFNYIVNEKQGKRELLKWLVDGAIRFYNNKKLLSQYVLDEIESNSGNSACGRGFNSA